MLDGKSILVTGATGSFGKKFVEVVLKRYKPSRLVVFSRDELKQFEMQQTFPVSKYPCLRYFIGDVRDKERLYRAFEGVEIVVHAAALKQVPTAEYNPIEFIKTNILGAENIVNAALDRGVKKVVALSTDKAAAPINLYGATKLCADKLFIAANNMKGYHDVRFSIVRYGNVIGSRGSVIPFFLQKRKEGVLPITHPEMTRFNISLEEGVEMVLYAIEHSVGGELFVPKIPSYRIMDIAQAICPNCRHEIIGIRPGEKLHEEMITEHDSINAYDFGTYYALLPNPLTPELREVIATKKPVKMPIGFKYNSGTNEKWLTVEEIREQIRKHVDPNFMVEEYEANSVR
ncbi:MAG: UDP-N-acetylglucosamine 4,6-dehydratase (inverting) [Candidatus Methanomethylicaceae archaeon]